jgi:hypothetical protein
LLKENQNPRNSPLSGRANKLLPHPNEASKIQLYVKSMLFSDIHGIVLYEFVPQA